MKDMTNFDNRTAWQNFCFQFAREHEVQWIMELEPLRSIARALMPSLPSPIMASYLAKL